MEKFSNKLPIILGVLGSILETFYSQVFYTTHVMDDRVYQPLFFLYKLTWILFNIKSTGVMIKYKFHFLTLFFMAYSIIETTLLIGYILTKGRYYSLTPDKNAILSHMKNVINGGFEPWLYRFATLNLEILH